MYAGSVVGGFTARDTMILGSLECRRYARAEFLEAAPMVYASIGKWVGRMHRLGVLTSDGRESVQRTFIDYSYVEFQQTPLMEACRAIKEATPAGQLPPLEGANPLGMLAALPYGYSPPAWQTCGTNRHEFVMWMRRLGRLGIIRLGPPRFPGQHAVEAIWVPVVRGYCQTLATPPIGLGGVAIYQRGVETVWVAQKPWRKLPPHVVRIDLPGVEGYAYYRGVRRLNLLDLHLLAARALLDLSWDSPAPTFVPVPVCSLFTRFSRAFLLDSRVAGWFAGYGLSVARAIAIDFYLAETSFPGAVAGPVLPGRKLDFALPKGSVSGLARGQPPMRFPSRRSI